jgi:hypothetical protein
MTPAVSVVISDFGEREPSWDRLRSCLRAVAGQDVVEPFEVVLCEIPALYGQVPNDIREMLLGLRVVTCPSSDPNARKTFGVENAWAPVVALLDADCLPQAGWLGAILDTFRYNPEVAVVHGRMKGEESGWLRRFVQGPETRHGGPARYTADNNVAYRRAAYLEYPLPAGAGERAVKIQTAAMLRAHYVLWEEPGMQVLRDRRGVKQAAGVAVEQTVVAR